MNMPEKGVDACGGECDYYTQYCNEVSGRCGDCEEEYCGGGRGETGELLCQKYCPAMYNDTFGPNSLRENTESSYLPSTLTTSATVTNEGHNELHLALMIGVPITVVLLALIAWLLWRKVHRKRYNRAAQDAEDPQLQVEMERPEVQAPARPLDKDPIQEVGDQRDQRDQVPEEGPHSEVELLGRAAASSESMNLM